MSDTVLPSHDPDAYHGDCSCSRGDPEYRSRTPTSARPEAWLREGRAGLEYELFSRGPRLSRSEDKMNLVLGQRREDAGREEE